MCHDINFQKLGIEGHVCALWVRKSTCHSTIRVSPGSAGHDPGLRTDNLPRDAPFVSDAAHNAPPNALFARNESAQSTRRRGEAISATVQRVDISLEVKELSSCDLMGDVNTWASFLIVPGPLDIDPNIPCRTTTEQRLAAPPPVKTEAHFKPLKVTPSKNKINH